MSSFGAARPSASAVATLPGWVAAIDRWFWVIVAGLLLLQAGLAFDSARRWTPTHDEYWHLPLGLGYWRTGDFSVDPINPPAPRLWASLPLWLGNAATTPLDPPPREAFVVGDAFMQAQRGDHRGWFTVARWMMIAWLTLGGVIIAAWARRWWGAVSGLIAALLWTGCPTLLAQGTLVTHDYPATVAALIAVGCYWRWSRQPRWQAAVVCGIALGIAQLTKLTAALLVPLLGAIFLMQVLSRSFLYSPSYKAVFDRSMAARLLSQLVVMLAIALLVLHLGYAGQGSGSGIQALFSGRLPDELPLPQSPFQRLFFAGLALTPAPYRAGWARLFMDLRTVHPVYLNGEWMNHGDPTYYLWAFADKLPLGTLALITVGAVTALIALRDRVERQRSFVLMAAFAVFFIPASLSNNQLGLRYVLPAYPWLILLAARCGQITPGAISIRLIGIALFVAATVPLSLLGHPHHLAYFNVLAGGSTGARDRLVDSNLDWGQDLHAALESLSKTAAAEPFFLGYFGTVSPSTIGAQYVFPPRDSLVRAATLSVRHWWRDGRFGCATLMAANIPPIWTILAICGFSPRRQKSAARSCTLN